jgi:hypothetical protein
MTKVLGKGEFHVLPLQSAFCAGKRISRRMLLRQWQIHRLTSLAPLTLRARGHEGRENRGAFSVGELSASPSVQLGEPRGRA